MPSIVPSPAEATLFFVPVVVLVATSLWVSQNAAARGHGFPNLLGALVAFVPVGLVAYLLFFVSGSSRRRPPSRTERAALAVMLAGVASYAGAFTLPPDPFTQGRWLIVAFVALLPVAYVVVYRRGHRVVTEPLRRQVRQRLGRQ
ncbi:MULTISPECIES: hypothetical protein [Haloferax]|uniref:Uncharacterized protein n=1 Tax=Haloferax massiliensis TaxID=1476858 RepID=A0A0D6JRC4_9EURY|nr:MULTISPECIES: hypothetical protein [Haloferax]MDS0240092.1 hypothetical protein [Haloferax sp. S2CR25]MDS0443213.1 hypothetical protein [Haloferax sp. S2CR25-2]CQR50208.1 hypothetical protein BN996_01685 [Haloferax massiliensis]